jgi:uncharacterized protein YdbL (DUF1318 family)
MKKATLKKPFLYSLIFFITSCVTINIYFPAAAVEKAADKIVEEVWGEKQKKEEQNKQDELKQQGGPQSMVRDPMRFAISMIGPAHAFAQDVDINVTTPAIRALKESIQKRADSIKPYMASGNAGISVEGLLVVRNTDGLNLKDKANLTRLIEAENKDRNALYVEIAKANNFPTEKISDIKKIFAGSWIKKAKQGWWFQNSEGKWEQK